jgi:hypothetical protein
MTFTKFTDAVRYIAKWISEHPNGMGGGGGSGSGDGGGFVVNPIPDGISAVSQINQTGIYAGNALRALFETATDTPFSAGSGHNDGMRYSATFNFLVVLAQDEETFTQIAFAYNQQTHGFIQRVRAIEGDPFGIFDTDGWKGLGGLQEYPLYYPGNMNYAPVDSYFTAEAFGYVGNNGNLYEFGGATVFTFNRRQIVFCNAYSVENGVGAEIHNSNGKPAILMRGDWEDDFVDITQSDGGGGTALNIPTEDLGGNIWIG